MMKLITTLLLHVIAPFWVTVRPLSKPASWIIAAISGVSILTSAIFSIRGTSAINTGNTGMSTTAAFHLAQIPFLYLPTSEI